MLSLIALTMEHASQRADIPGALTSRSRLSCSPRDLDDIAALREIAAETGLPLD
jgi:hypothetical protein